MKKIMKKANSSKWDKQSVLYCHEYTRAIIVRSNSLRGTWSLLSEIWSQCWKHEFEYNIFCHWKPQTAILSRSTRWAVNMRRVYWKKVWKSTQEAKKIFAFLDDLLRFIRNYWIHSIYIWPGILTFPQTKKKRTSFHILSGRERKWAEDGSQH